MALLERSLKKRKECYKYLVDRCMNKEVSLLALYLPGR